MFVYPAVGSKHPLRYHASPFAISVLRAQYDVDVGDEVDDAGKNSSSRQLDAIESVYEQCHGVSCRQLHIRRHRLVLRAIQTPRREGCGELGPQFADTVSAGYDPRL